MNGPTLQVQMLGQFTLRYGDRTIPTATTAPAGYGH